MFSRVVLRALASSFKITKAVTAAAPRQCYNNNYTAHSPITCILNTAASRRFYSQQAETMTVDFEYVKKATKNNNILIVDVREPDEIKEHGKIPNSINIPLGNVTTALNQLSDKEFEQTYKRPKPVDDSEIIFYCMIGKRSGMAQDNAQKIGYKNVKNYLGSYTDWAAKMKS